MRPCFAFSAAADNKPASLDLLDEIGFWGTQAKDFSDQLKAISAKELDVVINSPGGDVFAGLAMYNMLRNSGKTINVKIVGIAASAASVVAMAGDTRSMPKNTMMMVHNPWTIAAGNADEFRETADTLDKIGASLLGVYVARAGIEEAKMKDMLASDTYLTADEALEHGLATEVTDEIKVQAKFDLARADLPENVRAALGLVKAQDDADPVVVPTPDPEKPPGDTPPVADQIKALAVKAGLGDYSPIFALNCATVAEAETRIANAREIKSICALAEHPGHAAALIKANKSVVEARTALLDLMAKADEDTTVDTAPRNKQTTGSATPRVINTASIWASHHAQRAK